MRIILIFRYDPLWFEGLAITILGSRFFVFCFAHYFSRTAQCGDKLESLYFSRECFGFFFSIILEIPG